MSLHKVKLTSLKDKHIAQEDDLQVAILGAKVVSKPKKPSVITRILKKKSK